MRVAAWLAIGIGSIACVADPIAPDGDLAASDLGGDQGSSLLSLAWEPRRAGITGLRTRGVQTYGTRFFIDTPSSGIYYLGADAVSALPYIAAHPDTSRLVWVNDNEPVIAVTGALRRATGEAGTWQPFRGAIPATSLVTQYFETSSLDFALVDGLGIFTAPHDSITDFALTKSSFSSSFAPRGAESAYLPKGTLGLITYEPSDPANDLFVGGTGLNSLSASAIGWGSRTLVGGIDDGLTRVKSVVDFTSSDCGDPLGPAQGVLLVMPAGAFNLAVLDDHRVYTNLNCSGAWTPGGRISGTLTGAGITTVVPPERVVAIGTTHSLFRSSDSGASFEDISPQSPEVEILSIDVNPANAQHLVVGTDGRGLWESFDAGAAWSRLAAPTFHGDLRVTARFATDDTLLIGGDYRGSAAPTGGVFRGVFVATGWSFELLGTGTVPEPTYSVTAILPSTRLGPLGCFPSGPAFARYSGSAWTQAVPIAPADCWSLAAAADGNTVWIGGTNQITVVNTFNEATFTAETIFIPNSGVVRFVVRLDTTPPQLLVGADQGAFLVEGATISEVRYGGFPLGAVSALYDEPTELGGRRIWLASAQEPLLVSNDGETWQRVATPGSPHPKLRGLIRAGGFLYGASTTSVWRAPLP